MQALINAGVTLGVLPVTGLTLPFFSGGGSSILVTLAMVGVLLNVSRQGGRL
jgi:cell division protein FtsW